MNTRLVFLPPTREQGSPTLIADSGGEILARGMLTAGSPLASFKGRTILIVPGTEVVTRWLALEGGPASRVAEAAALRLKDQIGAARDSVHIALGDPEDDGTSPVSVIDRALMQEFLDRAAELGVSPDIVIPDHLMLPPPDDGVLAVTLGGIVSVRGENLAFSAEEDLASMLIGPRRRTSIDRETEIERLFAEASADVPINLLQQDFAVGGRGRAKWRGYRRAAALAAIAALSPLAIWTAEIVRNEASARGLETRAEATARVVLGAEGPADPVRELRGRIAALRANDGFMQTTAVLFEAVSHAQGVELESLSYLQEGVIRARIVHGAASDVSALRQSLEQSGIAVDEDAAEERDGRMVTTITLNRIS